MFDQKQIREPELWLLTQSAYFHVKNELTKYVETKKTIHDVPTYLKDTAYVVAKHHPAVGGDLDRLLNKLDFDLACCEKLYNHRHKH